MQLTIDYEGEHYTTNLFTQLDDISLADVLGDRALLNCFISDRVCNTWSRVPCIEILRLFLKEYPAGETAQLRFQHEKHSPTTSPPLPPSKDAKDWSLPLHTREVVSGQPIKDVVVIQSAPGGPKLSVRAESLLTDIKVAAESGTHAFSVTVVGESADGGLVTVELTRSVWLRCLLTGNAHSELFLSYLLAGFENCCKLAEKQRELKANKKLLLHLKFFVHDLMRFDDDKASARLHRDVGELYFSGTYFSEEERSFLLDFPTATSCTARECIQLMFQRKGDALREVCTSHDLAPILQHIYQLPQDFHHGADFKKKYKEFIKSCA
jgi:hypothetical protein